MVKIYCTRKDCPKKEEGWNYVGYKEYPGMVTCPYCKTQVRLKPSDIL